MTDFYFNAILLITPRYRLSTEKLSVEREASPPMEFSMAMQIFLDGQWVTVSRDDQAKAYIITSPDGSEETIPFGQKEKSD